VNSGPFGNANLIGSFNSTVAYDTTVASKFGNALKVTPTSSTAATTSASWGAATGSVSGATAGRVYSCSIWVYVPAALAGKTLSLYCRELGGATGFSDSHVNYTAVAGWQRLTAGRTVVQNDRTNIQAIVTAPLATSDGPYWAAAAQIEQLPVATPYIPTANSATATATRPVAAVQAPATLLSASQGWVALRVRAEWSSATPPGGGSSSETLFDWRTDSNNRYALTWDETAKKFSFARSIAGSSSTALGPLQTINPGDLHTVIAKWASATSIAISVDGGGFTTTTVTGSLTPALTSFALGNNSPTNNSPLDGEILWSAAGTGSLTNSDATTLNNFANTDPSISQLPGSPTLRWAANNTTYETAATTGYTTSYTYNDADQLTSQTDPAGHSYSFYYDSRGNLRGTQYPNSTFSWADTNPLGQLSALYNRHGSINAATQAAPSDSSGTPILDYTYTYNTDGQKSQELRSGGGLTTTTTDYSYDGIGRLAQTTREGTDCTAYLYDADSNRTQTRTATATGATCGTYITATTYSYVSAADTPADALTTVTPASTGATTYTYDGAGNTPGDGQLTGRGGDTFNWDGTGRIQTATVAGTTACYSYDPVGNLITRTYKTAASNCATPTGTTNYLLGDLFETNSSGTITTSYTDGPVGALASYNGPPVPTGTATYLYYNGHGDLAAEVTGTSITIHTYDAWGVPLDAPPANATAHRYTGAWNEQYDSTTSFILMGARPYDPALGRFLAVDPIDGGSLNNYDYAGQDPVNSLDLAGTAVEEGAGLGGGDDCCPNLPTAVVGEPAGGGEPKGGRPVPRSSASPSSSAANATLRGWWWNVKVFNNASAKVVEERISAVVHASPNWTQAQTSTGVRWVNEKEGIQLRISDYHAETRLYASRLGGGKRQIAPYAVLRP
jgi:RHS repeat-associated protein